MEIAGIFQIVAESVPGGEDQLEVAVGQARPLVDARGAGIDDEEVHGEAEAEGEAAVVIEVGDIAFPGPAAGDGGRGAEILQFGGGGFVIGDIHDEAAGAAVGEEGEVILGGCLVPEAPAQLVGLSSVEVLDVEAVDLFGPGAGGIVGVGGEVPCEVGDLHFQRSGLREQVIAGEPVEAGGVVGFDEVEIVGEGAGDRGSEANFRREGDVCRGLVTGSDLSGEMDGDRGGGERYAAE